MQEGSGPRGAGHAHNTLTCTLALKAEHTIITAQVARLILHHLLPSGWTWPWTWWYETAAAGAPALSLAHLYYCCCLCIARKC